MSISNSVLIAIQEIESQVDHTKPLKEKMLEAMKISLNHWLVIQDEEQFKAAVGAVLSKATEEEREQINGQLKVLQTLSAIMSGVQVDLEATLATLPKIDDSKDKLVLNDLWKQAKDSKK